MAAIEAGKHVYCEKPLTVALDDARKLANAAAGQGSRPWSLSTI